MSHITVDHVLMGHVLQDPYGQLSAVLDIFNVRCFGRGSVAAALCVHRRRSFVHSYAESERPAVFISTRLCVSPAKSLCGCSMLFFLTFLFGHRRYCCRQSCLKRFCGQPHSRKHGRHAREAVWRQRIDDAREELCAGSSCNAPGDVSGRR